MNSPDMRSSSKSRRVQVLVVEDDPDLIELWSKLLPLLGYDAATATSLQDAKTRLLAQPFDVILMDMSLPDANGLYGIRVLLETPVVGKQRPGLVVISGRSDAVLTRTALQEGVASFLGKPTSKEQIVAAIDQIMQKRRLSE